MSNYYILVEGISEKKIFGSWIPVLNSNLVQVNFTQDIVNNNFYIVSGGGYPAYFDMIDDAINDVNSAGNIDHLVISVDSEDYTREEKLNEITDHLRGKICSSELHIIIQHFCIETWGLGNIKIAPRNPKSDIVREYKALHDVSQFDPELLPPYKAKEFNRAQFAMAYLKALFNDRNKQMTHSKSNPKTMMHHKYLSELIKRYELTSHISSFNDFVQIFQAV